MSSETGLLRRVASQHLDAIVRYAEDEINCRRKPPLAYFGEISTAENCKNCGNCTADAVELTDITIPAQKFLSCVKRTGECFGAGRVTAVLRGSKNQKVLLYRHEDLSTYGIGEELAQKQWMHFSRQLVQMGFLLQEGEYRTLSLTEKASDALRDRTQIMGLLQEPESRSRKGDARQEKLEYDQTLFALLRQKRKQLAGDASVPPYVIFSERTLVEMSAYYPQSSDNLLKMSGVGQVKLRQYGDGEWLS